MKLIPIRYGKLAYPQEIVPRIQEIAGHFDVKQIPTKGSISLHTEYSYGPRRFDSPFLKDLNTIKQANKRNIPQLWFNEKWAAEFALFVIRMLEIVEKRLIIEIHPPFIDYCPSIKDFIQRYRIFEEMLRTEHPDIEILLENRCGTMYKGGRFLISNHSEINDLADEIDKEQLSLRIALDLPQLYSAEGDVPNLSNKQIEEILMNLKDSRHFIRSLHIWGKKRNKKGSRITHQGNLDDYFDQDMEKKKCFLKCLARLFDDDKERYLVPEVNSNEKDLEAIMNDFFMTFSIP